MSTAAPQAPFSADGEPLCLPPEPHELCEAARRRLPEIEAELRLRLSGPDRPVEAVELEGFAAGLRNGHQPGGNGDPLLEQGVLALGAAHVLGRQPLVHLSEGLALRGIKVQRAVVGPDQPPRALEIIGQLQRGDSGPAERRDSIEVCRTSVRGLPARTLIALAAAGLARPLVLIDAGRSGPGDLESAAASICYAGLPPALREVLIRAASPHDAADAAEGMIPLYEALHGRNPWHLYHIAEVPWRDAWAGTQLVKEPQLTGEGFSLAQEALGRPPAAEESFALACYTLGAAERLSHLLASADDDTVPDGNTSEDTEARLREALGRLARRPLLPQQDGEAPLLLRAIALGGPVLMEVHHPDETGRLLAPAGAGRYARVRLLSFPRERPRALRAQARVDDNPGRRPLSWFVDGGDLRVHIDLYPAGGLLPTALEAARPR